MKFHRLNPAALLKSELDSRPLLSGTRYLVLFTIGFLGLAPSQGATLGPERQGPVASTVALVDPDWSIAGAIYDCAAQTDIPTLECEALVALYDSTNGGSWLTNTGWLSAAPCSWWGVTCSSGFVDKLELHSNQLTGTIPPTLGNLTNLTKLWLHSNQLTGTIPPTLGNLTNLTKLWLQNNQLTGTIPPTLGNLTNLNQLSLNTNPLNSTIPSELSNLTNLTWLDLGNDQLTGTIPPTLGNLTNLTWLALDANQLTGTIPPTLGNLTGLNQLSLNTNQLTGTIPSELGNLTNLTWLFLYSNQLTGMIPSELGNLTNLARLDLSNNQLTGTIPPELGNLMNLVWLRFHNNQLTSTVPLPVAKVMDNVTGSCLVFNNDLCFPDIPAYQAIGDPICGLNLDSSCRPITHVKAKVLLEGSYAGAGTMNLETSFTNHIPVNQPFSNAIFDLTSLDYDTVVTVTDLPDSTVDWVLVSLRTDTSAVTEVVGSTRTAFVLANGSIVDTNGTTLGFPGVSPGSYRLVVRSRNHLPVLSSDTLDTSGGFGTWDFTSAMAQAYSSASNPMKDLGDGNFALFSCDINADGQSTAADFNKWLVATKAVLTGYLQEDCDLDGQVTASDFNRWLTNTKAVVSSQVPD